MKTIACKNCGSSELINKNGIWICPYCGSKFMPEASEHNGNNGLNEKKHGSSSSIEIDEDIARLLVKCRRDPRNARKYANLILDIDPDNRDALYYL